MAVRTPAKTATIKDLITNERLGLSATTEGRLRALLASHGMISYTDILGEVLTRAEKLAQQARELQAKKAALTKDKTYCPYYARKKQSSLVTNLLMPYLPKQTFKTSASDDLSDLSREEALEILQFDTQVELNGLGPEMEALLKQALMMNGISLQTLFPALYEQLEAQNPTTFRP